MKRLVSIALILFSGITTGSNAQTLRKTEPVVGGALCHYSDGSVIKKRGDSHCERSHFCRWLCHSNARLHGI